MSPTSYQTAPPRTHIVAYRIPAGQIGMKLKSDEAELNEENQGAEQFA
jgi:hypothetical protein